MTTKLNRSNNKPAGTRRQQAEKREGGERQMGNLSIKRQCFAMLDLPPCTSYRLDSALSPVLHWTTLNNITKTLSSLTTLIS